MNGYGLSDEQRQAVYDRIAQQYNEAQAQAPVGYSGDQARRDTMATGIIQGLETMATADAASRGRYKPDQSFYSELRNQVGQRRQSSEAKRREAVSDYLRKKSMAREQEKDLLSAQRMQQEDDWRRERAQKEDTYRQESLNLRKSEMQQKIDLEEKKWNRKNLPGDVQQRLSKMGGEQLKRLDSATMGFNAIKGMKKAFEGGESIYSLIGDNDYTMSEKRFVEAIGRMQSGGAINKDEAKSFLALAPKIGDDKDIREKKLRDLELEMKKRIKTMGFETEELGDFYGYDWGSSNQSQNQLASDSPMSLFQKYKDPIKRRQKIEELKQFIASQNENIATSTNAQQPTQRPNDNINRLIQQNVNPALRRQ